MLRPFRTSTALILLVVGVLVGGCLPQSGTQTAVRSQAKRQTASVASTPTTISWSFWGDPWEAEVNRRVARAFEAENPSIQIEVIHRSWGEYFTWLQGEWREGRAPDVMFLNYIRAYAPTGELEPLDSYMQRDRFDLSDFYPRLLELFEYRGSYYGLPRDNDTKVIYYNKTLFAEAGLEEPKSGWTWADLRNLASRLTKRDAEGRPLQYGFAFEGKFWWKIWVWQNGGDLVDDPFNPTVFRLGEPAAADAVQYLADMINADRSTPPVDVIMSTERISELFREGRLAMAFGNHAQVPAFAEAPGLRWDIVGLPTRRARANLAGGAGYVISSRSQQKDAAWEFLKFLEGPRGQALFAESGLIVPARRSIRDDSIFLRQQPYNARVFSDESEFGRPDINAPIAAEAESMIDTALMPVFRGERMAADAFSELLPRLQLLLER